MSQAPRLDVRSAGAYASLQDRGRRGYRRIGVPWAGVLDTRLMRIANVLAGNAEDAPLIECFDGGLQLAALDGAPRIAVAGHAVIEIISKGERRTLDSWRSVTLVEGEVLRVRLIEHGRIAMVAITGLTIPRVLGSASTYVRAGIGGIDGKALKAGDQLSAGASSGAERMLPHPPSIGTGPIRIVLGPQADHFDAAALSALVDSGYRVTSEADRMGVRLEGAPLKHSGKAEIVSDATVPGSIQVPGSGQPIVLLADAQTAGGYPKIATVVSADLARVAAARAGDMLRFACVDATQGVQLARAAEAETRALLGTVLPLLSGGIDETALYTGNLIGGVVHALAADVSPEVDRLEARGVGHEDQSQR